VLHLGRDGSRPRRRLHRLEGPRALEQLRDLAAACPQLRCPAEDFLGAVGVPPAQEHLAEGPVDLAIPRGELPRAYQQSLRFRELPSLDVHLRHGEEHGGIARMLARCGLAHLVDEEVIGARTQRVAQGDRGSRRGILPPALGEFVEGLGHLRGRG
jgi:hypothetical protein